MYATEMPTTMPDPGQASHGAVTPARVVPRVSTEEPHDLYRLMEDYERRLILLALQAAGGHQRRAASSLGLLPSTLSEKLRRLGLRGKTRAPRSGQAPGAAASAVPASTSALT